MPEPLSLEQYWDKVLMPWHEASDVHERYMRRSLVVWHCPVPYRVGYFTGLV